MKYLKKIYYKIRGINPGNIEMVKYWKTASAVQAKVTTSDDGSIIMKMEGEKYPFPTYPRGHVLIGKEGGYSQLSILKHQIKNRVFNDSWAKLVNGENTEEIIKDIKKSLLEEIPQYFEPMRYDMIPPQKMCVSVREIYRAWTKVLPERTFILRDYLCFLLQEDDAYRFRVQWLVKWFGWGLKRMPLKYFYNALKMIDHAEVIGDMKERMKLLRRIIMLAMRDDHIREHFNTLFREINWKKVALSKADAYHFRGKFFKVDYPELEY